MVETLGKDMTLLMDRSSNLLEEGALDSWIVLLELAWLTVLGPLLGLGKRSFDGKFSPKS